MAGSHTIPSSQLYPSTYTITSSGFTLTNDGIVDDAADAVGVLVEDTGDLVLNANKIVASKTSGGIGVSLEHGGYVQNALGATISGYRAIFATGSAAGTVVNTGTIIAYGDGGGVFGVRLDDGGNLTNNSGGGAIRGGYGGVYIGGASGTAANAGTVTAVTAGIFLRSGGSISNYKTGIISATYAVAIGGGSGAVSNSGLINGINLGVEESDGGSVSNEPTATINGALGVHIFGGAGTVSNLGTINAGASGTAVSLAAGFTNVLAIYPGSTITGTIEGGNSIGSTAVSRLQLGNGSALGTLTGIGTRYLNFNDLYVAPFASWVMGASIPSGMTLTDDGTLDNLGVVHTTPTLPSVGAVLTNAQGASITASHDGVLATAALATVVNDGTIRATAAVSYGVHFTDGGTVTNQSQGTITGASALYLGGTVATVVNMGQILGGSTYDFEVLLTSGGTIQNLGGTIDGGAGVYIEGGAATVVNTGKIAAEGANPVALSLSPGFADQLSIAPGAVFGGSVDGGNTIGGTSSSTLVMMTGASAGTISGIGSQYVNFGNFVVDSGASWVLNADSIAAGATLTDNGTLTNNGYVGVTATLGAGASLTNAKGALLGSLVGGVYDNAGFATILNAGGIDGVDLLGGGAVTNQAGGAINGPIGVSGAGLVVNAGEIRGDSGTAVQLSPGGEVAFSPGATFNGVVNGGIPVGGVASTLLLNPGTSTGTLSGIGSQYLNFGNFVVASAGSWAIASGQTIAANETLTDNGTLNNLGIVHPTVTLGAGASLTNASGGFITGVAKNAVYEATGPAAVTNFGSIIGATCGVHIKGGAGTVTNAGTIREILGNGFAVTLASGFTNRLAIIPGGRFGGVVDGGNPIGATVASTLELAGGSGVGTLTRLGATYIDFAQVTVDSGASWLLSGTNTIATGMTLSDAGTLTEAGALSNAGVIDGPITLGSGGSLTNQSVGVLDGSGFAAVWGVTAGAATVVNDGRIDPATYGIYLPGGGTITNAGDALIQGNAIGVKIGGGAGTVVNAGSIGGAVAMVFGSDYANRLVIDPGASFSGSVNGGTTIGASVASTLELASAASTGTLSGLGSAFQGFGSIVVDAGASWVLDGENEIANGTSLLGNGDVLAISGDSAVVVVSGSLSLLSNAGELLVGDADAGALSIENGATAISSPGTVAGAPGAVIANQTGAGGSSVNVTGAGSDWQVGGGLVVGNADTGVLAITNGANVSATTLDVGDQSSGAGIVTVSGPNADLTTTGTVTVGDAGSGELSILDGANANIGGDLNVANAGSGTGNVDIEDTTGTITFGGNIFVGFNGFGVFNIGYNVDYIQNSGGIIFGPDSSGAINSFPDPSPFLSNSSPSPISIGAQGVDQLAAYLFNSGEFTIPNNHSLTFETPIISGGGSFALGSGDSLVLNADTVTGQTFTLGSNDKLTIGIDQLATIDLPDSGTGPFTPEANPNKGDLLLGNFGGVIANFTSGDTIDVDTYLSSAAAGTLSQNGSVVSVIEIANGATLGVLRFDTAANAAAAVTDGAIALVPCFAAGTRIATERGEVAVEAIGVGDRVQVLLGDGFAEVIWVGRREVDCADHPTPRKVWPVRVASGAFGPGRPHADVFLSPDHAVFVNDVLVPVRHLINGSTIAQVNVDRITYHHIELAEHDVLLAEGLPAESFLDMRDRTNYANRAGPIRLYPDYSARMWEAFGCARLVVTGPELAAAQASVTGFTAQQQAA